MSAPTLFKTLPDLFPLSTLLAILSINQRRFSLNSKQTVTFLFCRVQMAAPLDTSMMDYISGSVDGQDDICRNPPRFQPNPLLQNDSAYGSTIEIPSSRHQVLLSPSVLTLANSVKCSELLNNDSNFAPNMAVECYESDDCSISTCRNCSRTPVMIS